MEVEQNTDTIAVTQLRGNFKKVKILPTDEELTKKGHENIKKSVEAPLIE